MFTAKPKCSRQNQNVHGKTKMFTAKLKSSRQKQKLTANAKTHGKSKSSRQKQKLTAKPKNSRQKQKGHGKTKNLTAKSKTHGKSKKLTAKPKPERCFIRGSWALVVHAKAFGVKSNMAASSSSSSQMFCSNCGAEAVATANFCTRCGQGNMLQVYFEYITMGELMNTR